MRYTEPVTILRAPLKAGYGGQQIRDWPNAAEVLHHDEQPRMNIQPESTTEVTDSRQLTITRWRAFGPGDLDLVDTDRIAWDGVEGDLEVDGEVERWRRRGRAHHVKAILKLVDED